MSERVNRAKPFRVYVSDSDRSTIEGFASEAGLSVSAYLLTAGLHRRPRSVVDRAAVADLARVNADLGRLGGLLKLLLTDHGHDAQTRLKVRRLLHQIEDCQRRLLRQVEAL